MATPRGNPYIWVTWLSSLMSGDNPCQWQPWFRANHQLATEQPSDFDLIGWKMNHTRMLIELADELDRREGALIRTEVELKHDFERLHGTLAGKADLICREPDAITVIDCKTGKERDSDKVQVMIYMWMMSKTAYWAEKPIRGEVAYSNTRVPIEKLPNDFEDNLNYFIKLLCRKKPPRTTTGSACKFCKITKGDCPDRVD